MKTLEITNQEIYTIANLLAQNFSDENQIFPIKVNFYLNKNINTFVNLGREIEAERLKVVQKYGKVQDDGNTYHIESDKIQIAQNELNELFAIEQTVNIYTVKLEEFGDSKLTQGQMNALMFMIDEEE